MESPNKEFRRLTKEFQKKLVEGLLAQCTEKQQEFFHTKMPEGFSSKNLENSYCLAWRTLQKNAAQKIEKEAENQPENIKNSLVFAEKELKEANPFQV